MSDTHREKKIYVRCPRCEGHKGICGKSSGPYTGSPATLPCPRCDACGEVLLTSLTEEEKNPKPPIRYERDDI